MENKKKINYFSYIMVVLFFIYLILFIASNNGYYEYKNNAKKILTEEKIKQFESDLKTGKNVLLENYLEEENILKSTKKKFSLKISEAICEYTRKTITKTFEVLSKKIEK